MSTKKDFSQQHTFLIKQNPTVLIYVVASNVGGGSRGSKKGGGLEAPPTSQLEQKCKEKYYILLVRINRRSVSFFFKWANPGLFLFIFCLFHITQLNKLMKVYQAGLGLKPRAAGWKAHVNPLSYGGTPSQLASLPLSFKRSTLIDSIAC